MGKIVIIFTLLLGYTHSVSAQNNNDSGNGEQDFNFTDFSEIGLTSPTATSLGEYGSVPVSMATGIPSISVPITTITAGELSVPVALNYHAGGIKVTEYASQVGLGWSMNAGGVITRVVNGYQDELSEVPWEGYFNNADLLNPHSDNYMNHWYFLDNRLGWRFNQNLYNQFLMKMAQNRVDAEPDVFFYNFGGYSGFFVIDGEGEFVAFPDANIKVEYTTQPIGHANSQEIMDFTLTLENGQQYCFREKEYSVKLRIDDDMPGGQFPNTVEYPYDREHATAWYLSSISSPVQQQEITFHYDRVANNHETISMGASTLTNNLSYENTFNTCADSYSINTSYSLSKVVDYVRLTSIKANNMTSLSVNYDEDVIFPNPPLNYRVSEIIVRNNNTFLKRFELDYINDTGAGNLLLLNSIQEIKGIINITVNPESNKLPPYIFTYDLGIPMDRESGDRDFLGYPRPSRGAAAQHLFGKVVGDDGQYIVTASRTPHLESTRKGVLHKIEYPTGGYSEFEYELNTGVVNGVETEIGGLRVKKITSNALDPNSEPIVKTYKYGDGKIDGFEQFIERGGSNIQIRTHSVIDGNVCKVETMVSNPDSPLFGHFVVYDSVTEYIDGGKGGARTETYDIVTSGGSEGTVYKRILPVMEKIKARADSLDPLTNSYQYITLNESETEYEVREDSSIGGYVSNISSLTWKRPDIHLTKHIVIGTLVRTDTTWSSKSGSYKRKWAYPIKKSNRAYSYNWLVDTGYNFITQPGGTLIVPYDSSRYVIDKEMNTIEEYEYSDPNHKQLTKSITLNSDSLTQLITTYKYAHEYNPAMEGLNMLSQPYSVEVRNGNNEVLKKHWTLWKDWGTQNHPQWLPCGTWAWDGALDNGIPVPPTSCN